MLFGGALLKAPEQSSQPGNLDITFWVTVQEDCFQWGWVEANLCEPSKLICRWLSRMPSNLGTKRAPFLVLGNFIRNLGLQKGNEGTTGHPSIAIGIMTCDYSYACYSFLFWQFSIFVWYRRTRNRKPWPQALDPEGTLSLRLFQTARSHQGGRTEAVLESRGWI